MNSIIFGTAPLLRLATALLSVSPALSPNLPLQPACPPEREFAAQRVERLLGPDLAEARERLGFGSVGSDRPRLLRDDVDARNCRLLSAAVRSLARNPVVFTIYEADGHYFVPTSRDLPPPAEGHVRLGERSVVHVFDPELRHLATISG